MVILCILPMFMLLDRIGFRRTEFVLLMVETGVYYVVIEAWLLLSYSQGNVRVTDDIVNLLRWS